MAQEPTTDEIAGTAQQLELPLLNAPPTIESMKVDWLRRQLDLVPVEDFARAINVTPQTLATWRCEGYGPEYTKLGKSVFYRREDLKVWIARCSTAPVSAKAA